MVESNTLKAIVCLLVILIGVSAVMPAIVEAVDGDAEQSQTFTQSQGERVTLSGSLYAVADDIRTSPDPAINVTIVNTDTDNKSNTGTILEGNETTVTLDGFNVTVSAVEVIDGSEAVIGYEYPLSLGLPEGANIILGNVTLLIMLVVTIIIMSILLGIMTGMF